MYLPPVNAVEARAVYALLRITPAMIRLDRLYDVLYFSSTFLHAIVRASFVAFGFSSSLRDKTNQLSDWLLKFQLVSKSKAWISKMLFRLLPQLPSETAVAQRIKNGRFFRWIVLYTSRWNPRLFRSTFLYYVVYTSLFTAVWLPLAWYGDFVLPHRYGLSHQSAIDWFLDLGKDMSVSAIGTGLIASFVLWGVELFPKRWPVIFAALSAPVIIVGIFLDPLFDRIDNKFTPLPTSSPLYVPLHRLADNAGVPKAIIYVVDKSRQTEETNAYVTGLGSSAQIVIWDTTIKRMKPDEVVAVTGHELGHYVEHHVVIGGLIAALVMFLYLPALKLGSDAVIRVTARGNRIFSLADPAALPVLFLVMGVYNFAASPITNAASRIIEHRADSYGLALTRDRLAMARAQVDLANQNLEDPYPSKWEVFWLDDHPPAGERIHFALYSQPMSLHRSMARNGADQMGVVHSFSQRLSATQGQKMARLSPQHIVAAAPHFSAVCIAESFSAAAITKN